MDTNTRRTEVLVVGEHLYALGPESQTVYSTRYFCGACRRGIGGVYGSACYGRAEYPEDLGAKNEAPFGLTRWESDDRALEYYAFCPWCGAEFEDEWWKDRVIQNERAIDHYQNPGTHKGDQHVFQGSGPECVANHWLAVSGGDRICWCDPEVEPGLMGCVIRHQDKRYEDVMAAERAKRDQELAARRDACVPMALPVDHDDATCAYCESNAYDSESCETCEGSGCEECEGHGFVGYSW